MGIKEVIMPSITDIIKGLWTADPEFLSWYIAQGRGILDYLHIFFDNMFYFFLYIARKNKNPKVQKQAIFWLGQKDDEAALKFFAEILLKKK